ncbi:tetratricopeptide repeat-containing protein [Mucilaginibacter celer]|uniref:DUF4071 domain-containing protein n=1 Tax=Mucilaginibacter celer TaxID=2305508 RepID=A0A494W3M6_9SPHI|nr:tetratricopeptide repeat-containing protein [Mucilaginibacter celer]AYL98115.1 hypothetical protein HYN43_023760 [Mucilaginibacter celer]
MKKVFIVRPFGLKTIYSKAAEGEAPKKSEFDFDEVEKQLIRPATEAAGLQGGTTAEVFEAGDVREDMFSELLLADLVIADISIYNANVFYELGIRHALRNQHTILIKCRGFDDTPFDIVGPRYVTYKKESPDKALEDLKRAIKDTLASDRTDSPVFKTLPALEAQDPEKYISIPDDFLEEVRDAEAKKDLGLLALLADEAGYFVWCLRAWRLIAEILYQNKSFEASRVLWEKIRSEKARDLNANDRLATVYQRLAESELTLNEAEGLGLLGKSDRAIDITLLHNNITPNSRAESLALRARNAKTRWTSSWKDKTDEALFHEALRSPYLIESYNWYYAGFMADLNHFYSGLNALGMLVILISLAEAYPEVFEEGFDSTEIAAGKLAEYHRQKQQLSIAVQVSVNAAKLKQEDLAKKDHWVFVADVDLFCLLSTEPKKVAARYDKVRKEAGKLNIDAIVRQLKLYRMLNVQTANVEAALAILNPQSAPMPKRRHYLLFTGHMIDKADRPKPRFPASSEQDARNRIKDCVLSVINSLAKDEELFGIAGGACGGDILFHEICVELEIPSAVYLALPREQFLKESVAFAGKPWIERFDKLLATHPHPVLAQTTELPRWLRTMPDYSIWTRNNQWLLQSALANGGQQLTLLLLWDGGGGDGPGGTEHMARAAEKRSAKILLIDANKLKQEQ